MKKIITISLLFFCFSTIAQQEPQYTMFWNNYGSFNPAYTGLENDLEGSLTYRDQWHGLGPQT